MVSQIKRSNRRKEDEQLDVDAATNPRNPKELTYGPLPHTTHHLFFFVNHRVRRIMSLKAEDAAMEDTLYNMMRALTEETIDAMTYLKVRATSWRVTRSRSWSGAVQVLTRLRFVFPRQHVRQLSREQFMVRAKLNKVRQT